MVERRCRYCEQPFQPSKFQPRQTVCGNVDCQQSRRRDCRRRRLAADPVYAESCRGSARKWRADHPDYWKQYRKAHPESLTQNREAQRVRDRKQRLIHLANNTSASDVSLCPATVWLLGPELRDLANNRSAPTQVWVLKGLPSVHGVAAASCKQPPSGIAPVSTA
jgi:hypothetical protein